VHPSSQLWDLLINLINFPLLSFCVLHSVCVFVCVLVFDFGQWPCSGWPGLNFAWPFRNILIRSDGFAMYMSPNWTDSVTKLPSYQLAGLSWQLDECPNGEPGGEWHWSNCGQVDDDGHGHGNGNGNGDHGQDTHTHWDIPHTHIPIPMMKMPSEDGEAASHLAKSVPHRRKQLSPPTGKLRKLSIWVSQCLVVSVPQYLSILVLPWLLFSSLFFFLSSLKMGCRNGGDGGILKQSCLVESDVASAADDWRQKKVDGKCWLVRCYDAMMVWWYPTSCPRNESEKPTAKNSIIKFACGHVIWSDCRSKPW